DRIGRAQSASLSYACTALGTLALLSLERWHHPASLYVYALLFGAGFGARGPIITAMASELFPGRQVGRIYGALSLWLGGALYDVTGSYRVAFLLASGFCVMGAACFWLAARPPARSALP